MLSLCTPPKHAFMMLEVVTTMLGLAGPSLINIIYYFTVPVTYIHTYIHTYIQYQTLGSRLSRILNIVSMYSKVIYEWKDVFHKY